MIPSDSYVLGVLLKHLGIEVIECGRCNGTGAETVYRGGALSVEPGPMASHRRDCQRCEAAGFRFIPVEPKEAWKQNHAP